MSSEQELSLRVGRWRTTPFCLSLCRGPSLATPDSASLNVPHVATRRHTLKGHVISASLHPPVSQPPTPTFAAESNRVHRPLRAYDALYAKFPGYQQFDDGEPCIEHVGLQMTLDSMQASRASDVSWVSHAGVRLTDTRNGPLLSYEEDLGPLSAAILHDADLLLSVAPSVLDENILYDRDWTARDMIRFNRIRINESVIACQWDACNDRLRVKEITSHLKRKHGVKSNPKPYRCFWTGCLSRKRMAQLSSLARHIQEHHGSMGWQCLTCDESFTRDETWLRHSNNCPGRSKLQGGRVSD